MEKAKDIMGHPINIGAYAIVQDADAIFKAKAVRYTEQSVVFIVEPTVVYPRAAWKRIIRFDLCNTKVYLL